MDKQAIAKYLDHTLLKANATYEQLQAVCDEAKKYKVAAVCVNSVNVDFVHKELKGSGIKTCSVVGFPLGAMASAAKAYDIRKTGTINDYYDILEALNFDGYKWSDYSGGLADSIYAKNFASDFYTQIVEDLRSGESILASAIITVFPLKGSLSIFPVSTRAFKSTLFPPFTIVMCV